MIRRLILLRHGRTEWNSSGRAQGHADIPLDERGHDQARVVAPYLASLGPAAVWSSDLVRARETAEYVGATTGLEVKYDERLREFDVGARQGMTMVEAGARFPSVLDAWRRGVEPVGIPGAESVAEVSSRLAPAFREFIEELPEGELGIVVTHGAAMKVGLASLLRWPLEAAHSLRGLDNCHWALVAEQTVGGHVRLHGYGLSAPGAPPP